jgi:hypothetical protein
MAVGLTQPLTEVSTRNISWGCVGLTKYHLHVPIVLKFGSLNLLEPSGPVQSCNGIALHLPCIKVIKRIIIIIISDNTNTIRMNMQLQYITVAASVV